MKVSFILPVYKVEKYLDECIKSIVLQTYSDIEIILVDDGSPDNCPAMCDYWTTVDSRIKVLHKINGGLSDARNCGLLNASGDYVIFVDSDDFWLHDDSLQKLVFFVEKYPQVDFIGFNCQYYYQDTNTYSPWIKYSEELAFPISGDKAMQFLVKSGTFPMSACLKIIKRSVLVNRNITFKKGQIAEDIPWFINLLEKSENCMFVNEYIYAYRQNVAGSITATGGAKSFKSLLDIVKQEIEKINSRQFSSEAKSALYSFLAYEVSILMAGIPFFPKQKRYVFRKELKSLCWLFHYTQNPKVRKVRFVFNFVGFSLTEKILWIYIHKKKIRKNI